MNEKKVTEKGEPLLQDDLLKKGMDRRSFLEKTTKMAGVALGATLIGSVNGLPVGAVSSSSVMKSNGIKPDLVFPVISDVHIFSYNDQNLNKFKTTLDQLNGIAPKQDAFVVVGDFTDRGDIAEYDRFMTSLNTNKQSHAVSLLAMGNHEYYNGLSVVESQKRFLSKTKMESLYYHKVIKGYHFIVLGAEVVSGVETFSAEQIRWVGEQLKIANADDPKKPIFVFHHFPITGTVYGSEWGISLNRDLFYETLKPYPQVISFSGHTHFPLDDPRIIHQEDFTSIGTSSGFNVWLEAGRIQGELPEGADFINQALVVEVYNKKVIIKRRDIHNDDWTGEPFEISFPSHKKKFKYTDRRRNKREPYFSLDSMVSIVQEQSTAFSLAIMLTQAKDDLLVHDYKIIAKRVDNGEIEKEVLAFSDFYKDPVPNPITLNIDGLKPNTLYELEVFALDAYGNQSRKSLKVLGKTIDGKEISISLSKTELKGVKDTVDVTVENARVPKSDWVGIYEVNEKPGSVSSIWWMWTKVDNGTLQFTYDPSKNFYPDRYKVGSTYKVIYFYGSGYDEAASTTFTVVNKE
jgi:Calcineurin-like phosphoesterase